MPIAAPKRTDADPRTLAEAPVEKRLVEKPEHNIDLSEVYRRTGIVGGRLPITKPEENKE